MPPLVFAPHYWNRVWGGRSLQTCFGRSIPNGTVGESWEVSAHPRHISEVADGPFAGRTLTELWTTHHRELSGDSNSTGNEPFPLLVKLLDCQQPLSIQVHPDDAGAARWCPLERGKSEAWVVLATSPDSKILAGLKAGQTRDDVVQALAANQVVDCLHELRPRVGDCIAIEPGTLHALLGPLVLLEVQPTSDATFRLFDWNRVDLNGQPRELHIEASLAVTNWQGGPVESQQSTPLIESSTACASRLYSCPSFEIECWLAEQSFPVRAGRMAVWFVAKGHAELRDHAGFSRYFNPGDTVLIPASNEDCQWIPQTSCEFIVCKPGSLVE